jgi:lipid II:glycine glycyltransferase (peptidoglycan interpeptide bridge formation enzyme)
VSSLEVFEEETISNPQWDDFLAGNPHGQFQQSSVWAQFKREEGWLPLRILLRRDGAIIAGFQILWRPVRLLGRIGYVSKGPLFPPDDSELCDLLIHEITRRSKAHNIKALIVQPPDGYAYLSNHLETRGFLRNYAIGTYDATSKVDLKKRVVELENALRRKTRKHIRVGLEKGVEVYEGDEASLVPFYDLMLKTCARRKVAPNPANMEILRAMWKALRPKGMVRLFLARVGSRKVSGLLVIVFGDCASLWKFGWSGTDGDHHPNEVLYWHAIRWAQSHGYRTCELVGINAAVAKALLDGNAIPEQIARSSSFFKLGFGGEVQLLPRSLIYFQSPIAARLYRFGCGFASGTAEMRRSLAWLIPRMRS